MSPVVNTVLASMVSLQSVLILATVLNTLTGVVYIFTARGEEQVWAVEQKKDPKASNL